MIETALHSLTQLIKISPAQTHSTKRIKQTHYLNESAWHRLTYLTEKDWHRLTHLTETALHRLAQLIKISPAQTHSPD